jgi:hypothetical protein
MEDWDQETLEKVVESKKDRVSAEQAYWYCTHYSQSILQSITISFLSNVASLSMFLRML